MKKKIILCTVAILCLALALFFGVVRFSADNIKNRKQGLEGHCATEGNDVGAMHNKALIFDGYIRNLRITGDASSLTSIRVELYDESGAVESLLLPLEAKNSDYYVSLERDVYALALPDAESHYFNIVEVNPTKLNINTMLTFFIFVLPSVLAWAIYNIIEDRVAFNKDVTAIKRYKYLLYDLVVRDIKTKYRRSVLGVLWSVLNPLLMMLVLTAVFSQIIKVPVEGGFALFYLTGYIIFNFISESSSFSLTSVINAGGLIKKVYIPKYVFPLEKTIFSLVNMLFSLIAFILVFVIFLITGQVELHATMLLFFAPMLYVFVFSFGLNLILSTLNVFFRDVGHLWGVFVTVWMYATPIIYPLDMVPSWLQSIIRFNPLYHYVTYFRNVMIYGTLPSLTDNLICIGFSVIVLAIGITVFRKNQDKFVLHI